MLLAISEAYEIGLSATCATFIAFSLVSAFVLPRMNPNFPGRGRNWYLVLCVCVFLGMMAAIIIFGKEGKPAAAAAATPPAASGGAGGAGAQLSAAAVAGKALFSKETCSTCHTFTPAGATGKVGPDLDDLAQYAAKAGKPIEEYATAAIAHPPATYVPPGFPTNAMPKLPLSPTQVSEVVAFLTAGSSSSAPSSSATSTSAAPAAPAGNAANGKLLFSKETCSTCHTFTPAGATGKVGPDLDDLAQYAAKAGQPVAAYATAAIAHPPASYVPPGFPTNAMPKLPLSQSQVADIVAFLTSGA